MEPLRRAIRKAFNAVDPACLYDLTGDPEEYQVEVDCLIVHIRTNPPKDPDAMVKLVHRVLCDTLHGGIPVGALLSEDLEGGPLIKPSVARVGLIDLRACFSPSTEEKRLGWTIWEQLKTCGFRK